MKKFLSIVILGFVFMNPSIINMAIDKAATKADIKTKIMVDKYLEKMERANKMLKGE